MGQAERPHDHARLGRCFERRLVHATYVQCRTLEVITEPHGVLAPVGQNEDVPARTLLDQIFDERVPFREPSEDVNDFCKVQLSKIRHGWRFEERVTGEGDPVDRDVLLVPALKAEKLGAHEPVKQARQTILAFGGGRKTKGVPGPEEKHAL